MTFESKLSKQFIPPFNPDLTTKITKVGFETSMEKQIILWSVDEQSYNFNREITETNQLADDFFCNSYLAWLDNFYKDDSIDAPESQDWEDFAELKLAHNFMSIVHKLQLYRNELEGIALYANTPKLFSNKRTLTRMTLPAASYGVS